MANIIFSHKLRLAKSICFALTLLFYANGAEGLRGCSSFGHSCFGAHGKRTDNSDDKEMILPTARVGGAPVSGELDYPINPLFDANMAGDFRGFGPQGASNLPPSRGHIPMALLKLLRNLAASNQEEQSAGGQKHK